MSSNQFAPDAGQEAFPCATSDADRLRALLARAKLSQREAARRLGLDERLMRQWCAGQGKPPLSVFRALSPRITWAESTRKQIESNDAVIAAMEDGRLSSLGYGPGLSDPASIASEIKRRRKLNEQLLSLLRLNEAFHRRQMAHSALMEEWSPQGSGVPSDANRAEADEADAEFRAAQAEVDRIAAEIRAGQR